MASRTILVIDADIETEQLMASTLESEGYLVFAVSGGDVGTEMAQKVSPSLIFINHDEAGFEMCKRISSFESLQKVPLVLLTSTGGISPGTGAALGVSDVLNVPFTATELLEKTAQILDAKAPIVLRVKEKQPAAWSKEDESEAPWISGAKEFGEEPQERSRSVKEEERGHSEEEEPEPADTRLFREIPTRRKKSTSLPVVIAGLIIIVVSIAGGLYYLGLIPGLGAKKTVSMPLRTVAKPKAITPAPAPSSTQPTVSENERQKQQAVVESKPVPTPASTAGKAVPAPPSTIPSAPVKKEPSPSSSAAPAAAAKAKPSGKTVYSVQVGVFKVEANAAALTKQFAGKGYDAFMIRSTDKDKRTLYRVLVGKSEDRKESAKLAARLREKEKIKAVVYAE